ncbi:argininosuccinate lyase [Tenacibaculum skagerrakense]|uniref:Argininosuccinate lyase n=1 Tax=Tenacibaculum skagerrakense TaxID=186571 RepID=A0A4R2NUC1_9FLAO|nr:argininosuccinate lyase [Tenacibaculum skagerrakense]TCP25689.1 argininosuccinate lyase [Tenacibaculum skagerrakense]
MKLWKKEFSLDKAIENFTVGNDREIDIHIAKYDVIASKAHAKMLASVGIISSEEATALINVLDKLLVQIENNEFTIEQDFEDVHSKIEFELTKELGETGKKIHTARSRNDQVLVALQLYYKSELTIIIEQVKTLFNTLISLANRYKDTLLPGYTHLQVAMPSSFGLWFSAYAETLLDDIELLTSSLKIVDQNPLGSAAGYGSSFPIDRDITTKELDFATLKYNVIAAQMARGKNERIIASSLGNLANTLSKFSMDICLYMSQNFGFITFPDELTTGSSIMPHKKNPDVFELVRGKCNQLQVLQTEMLLISNNLPSGYHRDFQLLKENMINGFENMKTILDIFNYSIQQVIVKEIDIHDDKYKYLFTVDNINNLVTNGIPFREAYIKISAEVEKGTYVPDLSKKHTHIGSIHNLSLDKIKEKLAAKF